MAKILVIDDDELFRDMLVQLLEDQGYETDASADGVDGLKKIGMKAYDLVITDIVMPEKEGLETLLEIRKGGNRVPVIVVSGGGKQPPELYLHLAKQFGADYAFQKPFMIDELLSAVTACLSRA